MSQVDSYLLVKIWRKYPFLGCKLSFVEACKKCCIYAAIIVTYS